MSLLGAIGAGWTIGSAIGGAFNKNNKSGGSSSSSKAVTPAAHTGLGLEYEAGLAEQLTGTGDPQEVHRLREEKKRAEDELNQLTYNGAVKPPYSHADFTRIYNELHEDPIQDPNDVTNHISRIRQKEAQISDISEHIARIEHNIGPEGVNLQSVLDKKEEYLHDQSKIFVDEISRAMEVEESGVGEAIGKYQPRIEDALGGYTGAIDNLMSGKGAYGEGGAGSAINLNFMGQDGALPVSFIPRGQATMLQNMAAGKYGAERETAGDVFKTDLMMPTLQGQNIRDLAGLNMEQAEKYPAIEIDGQTIYPSAYMDYFNILRDLNEREQNRRYGLPSSSTTYEEQYPPQDWTRTASGLADLFTNVYGAGKDAGWWGQSQPTPTQPPSNPNPVWYV